MSIFSVADAESFIADRVSLISGTYLDGGTPTPSYVLGKLRAAESWLETKLRVFVEPVVALPDLTAYDADAAAYDAAGTRYIREPAYDLPSSWIDTTDWGFMKTSYLPIISIDSIKVFIAGQTTAVATIPAPWIRIDRRYGQVSFVPDQTILTFIGGSFLLWVGFGSNIGPYIANSLAVRYTSGLQNVKTKYQHIVDLIYRIALLRMIQDSMPGTSGSISVDGLSQSTGLDVGKLQDQIDTEVKNLYQSFHGPMIAFSMA